MQGILGIKKYQTQKFRTDGKRIPVTIVEVNNNAVVAIKTQDRDGYTAVQLGYGTAKKPSKPMQGHIKGAKLDKAPQFLREIRADEAKNADELPQVGDFISLTDVLEAGDVIDVSGISKGKGFAGGVKRYHFKGGPATHGQSDRHRAPGSIGAGTTPGRVYKGKRMAGKMGFEAVTVKNLTVAGIDGNILYVEGLIPGKLGALVSVEKKNKKDKTYADLIELAEKAEAAKKAEETKQAEVAEAPVEEVKTEEAQVAEPVVAEAVTEEPVKEEAAPQEETRGSEETEEANVEIVAEKDEAAVEEPKEEAK